MALYWLDVVRYADTGGYHSDNHRDVWAYRDYVIEAFNQNKPFDQFTIEQLAGDLIPNATREQKIASGFNRNHMINFEGGAIADEYQVEYVVDRVEATSSAFMGLTMGCARCHSHKFDPISHKEFYQFFAFFNNVPERGLDGRTGNAVPLLPLPSPAQKALLAELEERLVECLRLHTVADVPIGAFMSGGLDSTLVVAMMRAHGLAPDLHTFSVSLPYRRFDEAPAARLVAARYGTIHHEEALAPSLVDTLPELVWHLDEPSDPLSVCQYGISRFARQHVKVVLTGEGADELLADKALLRAKLKEIEARGLEIAALNCSAHPVFFAFALSRFGLTLQRINIKTVTGICRHPASTSVGVRNIAATFEIGHFGPDSSRRNIKNLGKQA